MSVTIGRICKSASKKRLEKMFAKMGDKEQDDEELFRSDFVEDSPHAIKRDALDWSTSDEG